MRTRARVNRRTNHKKMSCSTRRSGIKTTLNLTTQHARGSCLVGAYIEVDKLFLRREKRCGFAISPLGDITAEGGLDVGLEEGDGLSQTCDFLCWIDERELMVISAGGRIAALMGSSILIAAGGGASEDTG
jgi:hypothetical protein